MSANVQHIQLVLGDDALRNIEGKYDLIHSYIVLQHIAVERGERMIRQLLSRLAPGGIGVFHITSSHVSTPLGRVLYWARTHIPGAHTVLNVLLGRAPSAPIMQGNDYSVTRVLDMLYVLGCHNVHVCFSNHQGNRGVVLFCQKESTVLFE
jgi:hypothetical protein